MSVFLERTENRQSSRRYVKDALLQNRCIVQYEGVSDPAYVTNRDAPYCNGVTDVGGIARKGRKTVFPRKGQIDDTRRKARGRSGIRIEEAQPNGNFTQGEGSEASRITRFQSRLKGVVSGAVRDEDAILLIGDKRRRHHRMRRHRQPEIGGE